jgi:hypothetical protein
VAAAPSTGFTAWLSVKGTRDIAACLFVFLLMANGSPRLLGEFMLVASPIAFGDMVTVLRSGGSRVLAFGMHGLTGLVMVATASGSETSHNIIKEARRSMEFYWYRDKTWPYAGARLALISMPRGGFPTSYAIDPVPNRRSLRAEPGIFRGRRSPILGDVLCSASVHPPAEIRIQMVRFQRLRTSWGTYFARRRSRS